MTRRPESVQRAKTPPAAGFLAVLFAAAPLALSAAGASSASTVDFNRDIRPILSDNCFACHGPDDKARKAKLRLDVREGLAQPGSSGQVPIVPGAPDRSELIRRITTTDLDDLMPPPDSGKKLTPEQIQKLRAWVAAGAPWQSHWAFEPPQRPTPPAVKNERWVRNPIDRFVLARLEQEGLSPAPPADKPTLARRLSLDLTGLPPSIEEVDAFLADKSPAAYEALVDRLLNSPHYGEHRARYWLDAARYADTHGYHIDAQRDIWAYRDYVIESFNQNKPFDQFTVEQLAGDLLPEPTREQQIATGYVRCNMSTGEGGAIEAEYAAKYAFDRVETTGTVWLGLTLVCARCHTHKYDPITQREYYQLYAFFNQLDEPIMDGNKPNPDPFMKLPSREQSQRLEWLKQHLADAQEKIDGPAPELDRAQERWVQQWHQRLREGWSPLLPHLHKPAPPAGKVETLFGTATLNPAASPTPTTADLTALEDHSVLATGPQPDKDVYSLTLPLRAGRLAGLRLETLPHESLPHQAAGRAADGGFHLSEFEAEWLAPGADGQPAEPKKLKFAKALADAATGEHKLDRAIDGKTDTAWVVSGQTATQPHDALFLLDAPLQVPDQAELRVRLRFEQAKEHGALGRFRLSAAQDETFVSLLDPPQFEPWQVIGPFKTDGLQAGFDHAYPPEQEIDLKRTYPGVREDARWNRRSDLTDGNTHYFVNELHGVHGAYYFYRTIRLPAPMRMEFTVRADDVFKLWVNDVLVLQRADPKQDKGVSARVLVTLQSGENKVLLKVVNHQGAKYFAFDKRAVGNDALTPEVAAILATTTAPAGEWAVSVRNFFRRETSEEFRELFANVARWREEQSAIERDIPTTLVAKERAEPRETVMLMRGEYDKPGEKVAPGVPAILPPLPKDAPPNRLGLARWLVDPANPLTARVTVNRLWQEFFGVGLVKTAEDFGVQGERPSHPELLDWLATEFVQSGWNVRHLVRLIVTSATYRQRAQAPPELWTRDPENRLLARGPRYRVDAEVVRDMALSVSGLLVEDVGGRSVKPYEPPGLWEAVSFNNSQKYVPEHGPAQYRRSLYTFWKRQSPPPNMLIFDAPTREYCVARRPRTNTPLQALTLLNDPQFVEASRAFARRILVEGGPSDERRIAYGFRLATARTPDADEVKVLHEVLRQQLAAFRADRDAAEKLLRIGDFTPSEPLDPCELAAWTTVASLILNLDETITKG